MAKGTVKWFNPQKGFGFIVNEEGLDVFVHYSNLQVEGFRSLKTGQVVEYTELTSEKGLCGKDVRVSSSKTKTDLSRNTNSQDPTTSV